VGIFKGITKCRDSPKHKKRRLTWRRGKRRKIQPPCHLERLAARRPPRRARSTSAKSPRCARRTRAGDPRRGRSEANRIIVAAVIVGVAVVCYIRHKK